MLIRISSTFICIHVYSIYKYITISHKTHSLSFFSPTHQVDRIAAAAERDDPRQEQRLDVTARDDFGRLQISQHAFRQRKFVYIGKIVGPTSNIGLSGFERTQNKRANAV